MTFKPNLSVKEGLDHLAKRLDPIIATRLAPRLGGHPWTLVLDILAEKRGLTSLPTYSCQDLQAQLRMLTERLGDLGYPFDDRQRVVSTVGNELRIVRNQLAHSHDFSTVEAFRAHDYCVRLLDHFGESEGQDLAKKLRHRALVALAHDAGVVTPPLSGAAALLGGSVAHPTVGTGTPSSGSKSASALAESSSAKESAEDELITPDPSVMVQEPSAIGDRRLEFEPWTVVEVGGPEVLDDLPKKAAKEQVRAVAVEIATYEGPIQLDRLTRLTAQSFGMQRLHAARSKKLAYQVRQAGLVVDTDNFVWPSEIDPDAWREFRPSSSTADRPFVEISPIEIANAAKFLKASQPGLTPDELEVAVLQTFGRRRRTKQHLTHLAKAMSLIPRRAASVGGVRVGG